MRIGPGAGRSLPALRIAASLLLVGGLAAVLAWPAPPAASSRVREPISGDLLPPLEPGSRVVQRFRAADDGLREVRVVPFTFGSPLPRCQIQVTLYDDDGGRIAHRLVRCAELSDGAAFRLLSLPPVASSGERWYRLEMASLERGRAPITFAATDVDRDLPPVTLAGSSVPGRALDIDTRFGRGRIVLDLVPETLQRLGQYRGTWFQAPVPAVSAALVGFGFLVVIWTPRHRSSALVLVLVAKGIFWIILVPPLESPDEAAHIAYAQFLAVQHQLPDRDGPIAGFDHESQDLQRASRVLHHDRRPLADRPDFGDGGLGPDARRFSVGIDERGSGAGASSGYSPVYYAPAAGLYSVAPDTFLDRVTLMRMWSALLGVWTGCLVFLIGKEVFGRSTSGPAALALATTFHPVFSQQMASVNNDALVIFGGALSLLLAFRLQTTSRPGWMSFGLGVAIGLALHGKPFAVGLGPMAAVAVHQRWQRSDDPWHRFAALAGAGAGGALASYGTWWVIATTLGRPPNRFVTVAPEGPTSLRAYVELHLAEGASRLRLLWVDSFWGFLSWFDTAVPRVFLDIAAVVSVATVGLVVLAAGLPVLRRLRGREDRRTPRRRDTATAGQLTTSAAAVVGMLVTLHGIEFALFRQTGVADLLQGRYLLVVLPAVLLLVVLPLRILVPRLRVDMVMVAVACAVLVLHVAAVGTMLRRFYL